MRITKIPCLRAVAAVAVILLFLSGCAHTVQSVASTAGAAAARGAAPALVDQLDAMNRPENQSKILEFARSPAVHAMARNAADGAAQGITDELVALASGHSTTRPDAATQTGTTEPIRDLVTQDVVPAVAEIVHSALDQAMRDLTSRETKDRLDQMIRQQIAPAIGDAVRQQLAQTLSENSQSQFMRAFHQLLYQEIIPAVRQMWDQGATDTILLPTRPDLSPAVRDSAHNLAFGTATGTHAALIQLGVLSESGDLTGMTKVFAWGAGIVLGLIGLAAAAFLVVLAIIARALWRRPIFEAGPRRPS